jgi:hypothetical protein
MNELTVQGGGLSVTVSAPEGADIWGAARAAFQGARAAIGDEKGFSSRPILKGRRNSLAERLRTVAHEVLADGRVHERREIAKAARAAGLNPAGLTQALRTVEELEQSENAHGRCTYRDRSVPSPYASSQILDGERPEWMQPLEPLAQNGGPHHHGTLGKGR